MLTIAITGGIGSGKSEVSHYLESLGFRVLYADLIAKEMTSPGGSSVPYIRREFGEEYIAENGGMDRAKMKALVYSNPAKMKLLEKGTTDLVNDEIMKRAEKAAEDGEAVIFCEIPLLFEKGLQASYDLTWLVCAKENTRLGRVKERDGTDEKTARAIISTQMSDEEKRKLAGETIENDGSRENLKKSVDGLLRKYGILPQKLV